MLIKTCKIEINHRFVIYRNEPTFAMLCYLGEDLKPLLFSPTKNHLPPFQILSDLYENVHDYLSAFSVTVCSIAR